MGEPGRPCPPSRKCNILTICMCLQTFGGRFQADGRLSGQEVIETISCDQTANTCVIPVPAPGAALVFLSDDAQASVDPAATQTYRTTAVTNPAQTASIDPDALARSNGHTGDIPLSGTSKGGLTAETKPGDVVGAFFRGLVFDFTWPFVGST